MGFFTFTDAEKTGAKIKYGSRMVYVRPDDTHLVEPEYDGYGKVDGHDVFVMLFEQNASRPEAVVSLLTKPDAKRSFDIRFIPCIRMYAKDKHCPGLKEKLETLMRNSYGNEKDFMESGWKRHVGISMMQENDKLPFLMKVTGKLRHRPYVKLSPSVSTQ